MWVTLKSTRFRSRSVEPVGRLSKMLNPQVLEEVSFRKLGAVSRKTR